MSKFKVGDTIRYTGSIERFNGDHVIIRIDEDGDPVFLIDGREDYEYKERFELVTTNGEQHMGRRTFKLVRDTPELRKGALVQEACDDGTQEYKLINDDGFTKYPESVKSHGFGAKAYARDQVEQQPTWFVEVFQVVPSYMTRDELDRWEAFQKPSAKKTRAVEKTVKRKYVKSGKYAKKAK